MLGILIYLSEFKFGISELAKVERIPDFLGREYARDKEIFDLKQELIMKI